jgi:hypothetical protein
MDLRDKIFLEMMKGFMSNPNLVRDVYTLNVPTKRKQIIEMGKLMTNTIMGKIADEEDDLDLS